MCVDFVAKTEEGPETPSSGSKKKTEERCEMMRKKHAMEYAIKIGEILTLVKEMSGGQKEKEEVKARKG